jgi:hypothetical protein
MRELSGFLPVLQFCQPADVAERVPYLINQDFRRTMNVNLK